MIASGQPGAIFINCMRNTWNKAEKLKSRKRIDQVFKQGKSFSAFPFKVFYVVTRVGTPAPAPSAATAHTQLPPAAESGPPPVQIVPPGPSARLPPAAPPPPAQAGFGAGSRHFKRAVDRNRIKRLCREAYRLQKQPLYDHLTSKGLSLALFFIYTGKDLPDYQTVSGKIGVILQKLVRETA